MSYLLDTNVVSDIRKSSGDANVRAWLASVKGTELYLSVLMVGEIRRGIERLRPRNAPQAEVYEAWLHQLEREYRDRIIPISIEVAEEWGRVSADRTVPVIDGLMAATAKVHDLTLVSRNTGDVEGTGVRLLNPFAG